MRVALLNANAPAHDAVGNHIAEKAAFFADRGADVRVFVLSGDRLHPGLQPFCRVLADPQPSGDAWTFASRADIVIVDYSQYHPFLDWLPLLTEHRPRLVVDYHGVTPVGLAHSQQREVLEQGARQRGLVWFADAIIIHSRFARRELLQATGCPAERLLDLGYVIDGEQFHPARSVQPLKHQLGLDRANILLFVGRVAANKRLPILVESLAELRDESPPVHAVVIGDTTDVYKSEADRCRQYAAELGVADRLHFLGQVNARQLLDVYNSADVFVLPSVHEAFSLPVREAMACGLPVVAARAGALPEAVGSTGLTFTPDDPADLARQVRRALPLQQRTESTLRAPLRVAVVACRYGPDVVGGAETSLRTIAESLHQAGHRVEVFTTSATTENDPGTHGSDAVSVVNGIRVLQFPLDRRDPLLFAAAQQRLSDSVVGGGRETQPDYMSHSMRSIRLISHLRERIDEFDAVITGPYLHGLPHDVARVFAAKTIVLPCFHDEPAARLPALLDAYRSAGGLLYHSPEEQRLAEVKLGVNHPRTACIGTWIDTDTAGQPEQGRRHASADRYLLYAGRYASAKNLPLLLAHARRYSEQNPGRFKFVFIGGGESPILQTSWAIDLGNVDPVRRRDLLAGASSLIQLSQMESLSLVVLEAWSQGVPVIVHRGCNVLAAQIARSQGGWAVADYDGFAAALDQLWQTPEQGQDRGQRGQEFVRREYGSRTQYVESVENALRSLSEPLRDVMSRRGIVQASRYVRSVWREQCGEMLERVLDAPARQGRFAVEVRPRIDRRQVAVGLSSILLPVRVHNQGTEAVASEGLARWVLKVEVRNEAGQRIGLLGRDTPLPSILPPGQAIPAGVRVPVPEQPGKYVVTFRAEPAMQQNAYASNHPVATFSETTMRMDVEAESVTSEEHLAFFQTVQDALNQAELLGQLPDGYEDVTQGFLATWKRQIKAKLLNNFKRAYVDVLSRQQSNFNQTVLRALHELAECCGTLAHAQQTGSGTDTNPTSDDSIGSKIANTKPRHSSAREAELIEELAQNRRQIASLERRLGRLEALLLAREMVIT